MKKTKTLKPMKVFYRDTEHDFKLLEVLAGKQGHSISSLVRKYVHEGIKRDSRKRIVEKGN